MYPLPKKSQTLSYGDKRMNLIGLIFLFCRFVDLLMVFLLLKKWEATSQLRRIACGVYVKRFYRIQIQLLHLRLIDPKF